MRFLTTLCSIAITMALSGCSGLPAWVKSKKFTHLPSYSTFDVIGQRVDVDRRLSSNPYFNVDVGTFDLPSERRSRIDKFDISGSADFGTFISRLAKGDISGNFEYVKRATVTINSPKVHRVMAFIPKSAAPGRPTPIRIADQSLVIGDLTITVTEKTDVNAELELSVDKGPEGSGSFHVVGKNTIRTIGANLVVGYTLRNYIISSIAQEHVSLTRADECSIGDIGACIYYIDSYPIGGEYEALVLVSPSTFERPAVSQDIDLRQMQASQHFLMRVGELESAASDPREGAGRPTSPDEPMLLLGPTKVLLRRGAKLGMPVGNDLDYLYMEVRDVQEDSLVAEVQRLRVEVAK